MRKIKSYRISRPLFRALLCAVLVLCCAIPARAQTWTGNTSGSWSTGSNWSSNPFLPLSGIDTALIFNAAGLGGTALTQNLAPNPFLLNSLSFNASASAYTIGGNGFDFRLNTGGTSTPHIDLNTNSAITFNTAMTFTNTFAVFGVGSGTLNLNGPISGASGLIVNTAGTVSLGNASNNFAGPVTVSNGTLALGTGAAIPAGRNVSIFGPGVFSVGGLSNTAATAIGTVAITDGIFKIPSGSGNYFINRLNVSPGGSGGPVLDFTGSTNATLHMVNPGAGISLTGFNSWIGGGTSRLVNDTAAPIDLDIGSGQLNTSLRLANGAAGQGFRLSNGGSFIVTNSGNTANLILDNNSYLNVNDINNLGTGSLAIAGTNGGPLPGTLNYTGPAATSNKPIALGLGGAQIWSNATGSNLTLTGVISESVAGQRLILSGDGSGNVPGLITLTANNTYTGPTIIGYGITLSTNSIPNGGVASPIGASTSIPANLQISGGPAGGSGTLQYTGPTATTNRGATLNSQFALNAVEVTNAATNLTFSGQFTGPGALTKLGPGTLTLTSTVDNWSSGTIVNAGRLAVGASGNVLPPGKDITVANGAELNLGTFSNGNGANALGTVNLNGGALRVPTGSGDYYINKLATDFHGGTLDWTGTGAFFLHFVNSGASISIGGNSTWTTTVNSLILNESGASMDFTIAPNVTLTNGIHLGSGEYRVTGGGTLYQTTGNNTATLTLDHSILRVDDPANVTTANVTLDNGTFQFTGPSFTMTKNFVMADDSTFDVTNPSTNLSLTSNLNGAGRFIKNGAGTLTISSAGNQFIGGITVSNGHLDVPSDANLGIAGLTANALGTIRYVNNSSTSRSFNLLGGVLESAPGVNLTLNGASVGGGFLRGAGIFTLTGNTSISGATTSTSTTINQTGPASVANFTNNGQFTINPAQTLNWNGGANAAAGRFIVNGNANVNDFVSTGQINISPTGNLSNNTSSMVLGGGSTTFIGSVATPGGTLNAAPGLELNGALLVNNGTITGPTNVNFGSLAKGSGTYGTITVTDGGKFSPGNSPGTVTTGSTTWGAGGGYLFEINNATGTAGANWDLWNMNGGLDIAAGTTNNSRFTLTISSLDLSNVPGNAANFNLASNYSWMIASATTGITGFAANKFTLDQSQFTNPIGSGTFSLNPVGNNLFLNFTAGALPPPQWNVDASGSWGVATNWDPTIVPNGSTAIANFLGKIGAPRTIMLDGDKVVGSIAFDNSNSYTITSGSPPTSTLTIRGGVASDGNDISVANGAHTITAPVILAGSTNAILGSSGSLTLSGGLSIASGETLSRSKAGTLTISGPQNHGEKATFIANGGLTNLNSNAGTPAIGGGAGAAAIANLSVQINQDGQINLGADQDLRELSIAIGDAGPQQLNLNSPTSPAPPAAPAFRSLRIHSADLATTKLSLWTAIKNAHSDPAHIDGIYDSGLGFHTNGAIGLAQTPDAHGDPMIFIRLTRIGDLNLDGNVSIADFIDLAGHFNQSGPAITWQEGDINYDGTVSIADFIDLAANFNQNYAGESFPISLQDQQTLASFAASIGVSAVPEPGTLLFLGLCIPALTLRLRSKTVKPTFA